MAQTGVVTILGLEQKSGTGKNGKPYTISKIKASDGNTYDTFEIPLYQAASAAGQSPVVLEYETRENNGYTNYDLKGVSPANGQAQQAPVAAPVEPARTMGVPEVATYAQEKDARITRLSAASTAFDYAAGVGLDEDKALALADRIEYFANHGLTIPAPQIVASEKLVAATGNALPWDTRPR